jgi:hypothetical protein
MNFENSQLNPQNKFENPVHFLEVSKEHSLFPQVEDLFNQIIVNC